MRYQFLNVPLRSPEAPAWPCLRLVPDMAMRKDAVATFTAVMANPMRTGAHGPDLTAHHQDSAGPHRSARAAPNPVHPQRVRPEHALVHADPS